MITDRSKVVPGTILALLYKGKYIECRVIAGNYEGQLGFMLADGLVYKTLSAACRAVYEDIRKNGWLEWDIRDEVCDGTEQGYRAFKTKPLHRDGMALARREEFKQGRNTAVLLAKRNKIKYEKTEERAKRERHDRKYGPGLRPSMREARKAVGENVGLLRPERVLMKLRAGDPANATVSAEDTRWICTACVDYYDFPHSYVPVQCPYGHPAWREATENRYYGDGDVAAAEFAREFWSTEEALAYALNDKNVEELNELDNDEYEVKNG